MKQKSRSVIWVAAALLAVSLTACGQADKAKEITESGGSQEESLKTPLLGEFETQTIQGDAVNQDILAQADLTMVNVWATFCTPCINEMPELGELAKEYEGQGVQIVGIISDVTETNDQTALDVIKETGVPYTNVIYSKDLSDILSDRVHAVPTTMFFDKEGRQIGESYLGAKDKKQWTAIIEATKEATK